MGSFSVAAIREVGRSSGTTHPARRLGATPRDRSVNAIRGRDALTARVGGNVRRGCTITKRGTHYKRALYLRVCLNIVLRSTVTALISKGTVLKRRRFEFFKQVHDLSEIHFKRLYRMSFPEFMTLRDLIHPLFERRQRNDAAVARSVTR